MRKEYCEKDGISVTYTDKDVCFEDMRTAEAIIIANNGNIKHNDFFADETRTQYFLVWFGKIYTGIAKFWLLDKTEETKRQ